MKYKIGDKVKIKTWDQMLRAYGMREDYINCQEAFFLEMEDDLRTKFPDRILTIKGIRKNYYFAEGFSWNLSDNMIECLIEKHEEPEINRFELMDLE